MFHGQDMGPIGFEEIIEFAEQGQLEANDEVRLGATGKWRRVGSIGRLVAVLPYHEPVTPAPVAKVTSPIEPEPVAATTIESVAEQKMTPGTLDTALIQAEAAYAASSKAAHSLVAWALAPNVDPAWWTWIGGAERGPVGFVQIYDWAIAGQLQATDYVRNGLYGQYVPAANVPGLLSAVSIVADAKQALETARAISAVVAETVAKSNPHVSAVTPSPAPAPSAAKPSSPQLNAVPAPVAATKPSNPNVAAVTTSNKTMEPDPPKPAASRPSEDPPKAVRQSSPNIAAPASAPVAPTPAPRPITTPSVSSYASAALTPSRPAPAPRPQPKPSRSTSSGPGIGETLKDPKVMGGLGAAVLLVGLIFGWQYLPMSSGKDVEIYQKSKQLLDDVRAARVAKSTSFDAFKSRAQKLKDEYVPRLKDEANNQRPHKQALLFAIRDEFPRMMSGNLAEESIAEKNVASHLKIVADTLGLK
jgi:hypothetical protein